MIKKRKKNFLVTKGVEYIVKPYENVVVAKVHYELNDDYKELIYELPYVVDRNKILYEINMVGVAKCSSKDHFDEEQGKKVALAKANINACILLEEAFSKYIKRVSTQLEALENIKEFAHYFKIREKNYVRSV